MPYLSNRTNALTQTVDPVFDEGGFRKWYVDWAIRAGIDPDPDNPEHRYDYRAAYRAGAEPEISEDDGMYHWPSTFKAPDHPNRYVNGVDTITGQPINALRPEAVAMPEPGPEPLGMAAETRAENAPPLIDEWRKDPEFQKLPNEQKLAIFNNYFDKELVDNDYLGLSKEDQDAIRANFIKEQLPNKESTVMGVLQAGSRGILEGLTTELPGMVGGAMQFAGEQAGRILPEKITQPYAKSGKALKEWSEEKAKEWFGEVPKDQPFLEKIVYEGSKMLAPSVIPGGVATTAARVLKGVAGLVEAARVARLAGDMAKYADKIGKATAAAKSAENWGGATAGVLFGLNQAQSDIDAGLKNADEFERLGKTEEAKKAREATKGIAPYITGAIEAAGEFFGTKYLTRYISKALKLPEEEVAENVAKKGLGYYAKELFRTLGVEIGTEVGQQAGEAGVAKYAGLRPEADIWQETLDVIGPTAFMTLLTGGFATAAGKLQKGAADRTALEEKKGEEKPPVETTETPTTTTQPGTIPTEEQINRMFGEAEEAAGIVSEKPEEEEKPKETSKWLNAKGDLSTATETELLDNRKSSIEMLYGLLGEGTFKGGAIAKDSDLGRRVGWQRERIDAFDAELTKRGVTLPDEDQIGKAYVEAKKTPEPGVRAIAETEEGAEEGLAKDNLEGAAEDRIKLLRSELESLKDQKGKKAKNRRKALRTSIRNLKSIVATEQEKAKAEGKTIAEDYFAPEKKVPGKPAYPDMENQPALQELRGVLTGKTGRIKEEIDQAAAEAATSPENELPEPTEGQKSAENYQMGHPKPELLHGLDISIENAKGSTRKGTNEKTGEKWEVVMQAHYGHINGTEGADTTEEKRQGVDVFIGEHPESETAFIIDQVDPEIGDFDEHKTMVNYADEEDARKGYLANYAKDWKGLGAITAMPMDQFKTWLKEGDTKKPVGELPTKAKIVQPEPAQEGVGVVPGEEEEISTQGKGPTKEPKAKPPKPEPTKEPWEDFLNKEANRYGSYAKPYEGGQGVAAGAEGIDYRWKEGAIYEMRDALRRGESLDEAEKSAKAKAREYISAHNKRRPKDTNWQRWEGAADEVIESAKRRLLKDYPDLAKKEPAEEEPKAKEPEAEKSWANRKPTEDELADALISKGFMRESDRGKKQYAYTFRKIIPLNKWLRISEIADRLWNPTPDGRGAVSRHIPNWVSAGVLDRMYRKDGTPVYAWKGTAREEGTYTEDELDNILGEKEEPKAKEPEPETISPVEQARRAEAEARERLVSLETKQRDVFISHKRSDKAKLEANVENARLKEEIAKTKVEVERLRKAYLLAQKEEAGTPVSKHDVLKEIQETPVADLDKILDEVEEETQDEKPKVEKEPAGAVTYRIGDFVEPTKASGLSNDFRGRITHIGRGGNGEQTLKIFGKGPHYSASDFILVEREGAEPKVAATAPLLSQTDISARLPEGKKLKDYTVKIQAIREKTGEKVEIEENAQIALNEVDGKIETYRKLLECVNA